MRGNRTVVKVVKNKMAPPFRKAEFDIIFNVGISYHGDILDLGVEEGLVSRAGTWYSLGKERIGQGRERAVQFLRDHPDLSGRLDTELRQRFFGDGNETGDKAGDKAGDKTGDTTGDTKTAPAEVEA